MNGEGIRRIATLSAVVFAAGAFSACGEEGSSTAESSPAKEASSGSSGPSTESGPGSKNAQEGGSQPNGEKDAPAAAVDPAPLEVSGGGSAQYRVKGGDNSIQEFGEESDEADLEEAATALHGYLVARAGEDWAAACSRLAKTVKSQLDVLASRSGQLKGKGCAEILGALTPPLPAEVRRQSTVVDAGSLRTEDGRAFLIYRGAGETEYTVLMEQEDGAWKVGSLAATPIS